MFIFGIVIVLVFGNQFFNGTIWFLGIMIDEMISNPIWRNGGFFNVIGLAQTITSKGFRVMGIIPNAGDIKTEMTTILRHVIIHGHG
jgi:hypothetical protein